MTAHLYRYSHRLKAPLNQIREGFLLELDGGWGEIAPLPGRSHETLSDCETELKKLWPNIHNAVSNLPAVQWGLRSAKQPWPPKPFRHSLSALLWDLPVPQGYRTVKLKVKNLSIQETVQKIKQLHSHELCPKEQSFKRPVELRLDVNRAWNLEQALEFARHFKPEEFAYLEEPLQTLEELTEFSHQTRFPIAIDESLLDPRWRDIPTVVAAVVKPMILGFIPELPPHIDLIVSGVYETWIGTLHNALIPTKKALGLDTYRFLPQHACKKELKIENGELIWDGVNPRDVRVFRSGKLAHRVNTKHHKSS